MKKEEFSQKIAGYVKDVYKRQLQYLGMQMEWEKGHQLRHITGAGLDMYCMYNDSGKRIRKTVNGVTTDFYLDGSAILMQTRCV